MSLVDELAELAQHDDRCITCSWYLERSPQEQANFDAYLALIRSKRGTYAALRRVCMNHGLECAERTFRQHFGHGHHDRITAGPKPDQGSAQR